jgi:hypothetical protein
MQYCCLMYASRMTQTGLRERSKARRQAAIIRAAYELFAERGYDATTVADIAEAAEVAPRTVAMYFPAKQDIALSRFSDGVASLSASSSGNGRGLLAVVCGRVVPRPHCGCLLTCPRAGAWRGSAQVPGA